MTFKKKYYLCQLKIRSMKNVVFVVVLLFISLTVNAQDAYFTQYSACPLYLNPSWAGNCDGSRIAANYRNQWPGIGNFQTMNISYDRNFEKIKSGLGMQVMAYLPSKILNYYYAKVFYAYNLQVAEDMYIRAGIGGGVSIRQINGDAVILPGDVTGNSYETIADSTVVHADFSIGMSFNYANKYFGGICADHVSLLTDNSVKYMAIFGMNIDLPKNGYIMTPSVLYQNQEGYDMLSLTVNIKMHALRLGTGYNLNINHFSSRNVHSMTLLGGLSFSRCDLCYSYDVAFSSGNLKLHGTHELSLVYCFGGKKK